MTVRLCEGLRAVPSPFARRRIYFALICSILLVNRAYPPAATG